MCGIAGFFTELQDARLKYVTQLLGIQNLVRGKDSWGIYTNSGKPGDIGVLNKQVDSLASAYGVFSDRIPAKGLCMLHTRAASQGPISPQNAHPFRFNHQEGSWFVGAHNGSVREHEELNTKFHRNFEVDSCHLLAHIYEGRDTNEITARGAIQYIKDGRFFLAKFHNGDLAVAQLYRKGKPYGIVWSSVQDHLTKALRGSGFQPTTEFKLYDLNDSRLYRYNKGILVENLAFNVTSPYAAPAVAMGWPQTSWREAQDTSCAVAYKKPRSTITPKEQLMPGKEKIAVILRIVSSEV